MSSTAIKIISTFLLSGFTLGSSISTTFVDKVPVTTIHQSFGTNDEVSGEGFTDRLYSIMPNDINYMYSPYSVKMALAMAANGAEGATKDEILSVLGIENLDVFNEDTKSTIEKYSRSDLLKLDISNSIWLNTDKASFDWSDEFTETISEFYNGESGKVTDKDAVKTVNGWVNDKTNGKIPTIINSPDFDTALINTIYFRGKWKDEFSKSNTYPEVFQSRDGKEKEIDFMHTERKIPYAQKDNVKVIELPYRTSGSTDGGKTMGVQLENSSVSMYLLLSEDDSVKNPEKIVSDLIENFELIPRKTKLAVPKFKIEFSTGLNSALNTLGIKTAFTGDADFGKMTDNGNGIAISSVIHKTFIEIDEEGTEAAAVTAVLMLGSALQPPEEIMEFKADKPFTFLIRDNVSGETLFIGEYAFAQ